MGIDFSKERACPPLAIACVAEVAQFDVDKFEAFCASLRVGRILARRSSRVDFTFDEEPDPSADDDDYRITKANSWRAPDISMASFSIALEASGICPKDCVIFEHMFGLMDRTGDEMVHSLELQIGIALIVKGDFSTKLKLAVASLLGGINDVISPKHIFFLVSTATTVANYFGDHLLPLPVLEGVADDVYQELMEIDAETATEGPPMATLLTDALLRHPIVQDYVSQDK